MDFKASRQSTVSPSDFLYYDPYYLLLKERSKSYPKVVEKYYKARPAVDECPSSSEQQTKTPSGALPTNSDISEIMSALNGIFDGTNLMDANNKPYDFLSSSALVQSLISTSITEATAFDPLLGSRIRKIGDYVTQQDTLIRRLISRTLDLDTENKKMGKEAEESAARLQSNTRAMNSLYSDVDSYKQKLEFADKRSKDTPPHLQQELATLRQRYYVAMKIIDKMNWPVPAVDDEHSYS